MADRLLLCRHMSRADEKLLALAAASPSPSRRPSRTDEPEELVAIANVLRETLAQEKVHVTAIRHAPTMIAITHASWLERRLGLDDAPDVLTEKHEDLDPQRFMGWPGTAPVDRLVRQLIDLTKQAPRARNTDRAVLVIGHMPQLGWLAARLMGNRSRWMAFVDGFLTPLALQNGEVACIALADLRRGRPAGRLQWTVGPDETNAIEDLRDKIKSKMDIAKLLGGFITLVLGGVVLAPGRLDELSRGGDRWAVYVAAVSFLIAIGLYLRTMYAYDTLLMPKRYWGEGAPGGRTPRWLVRRPPSDAAWVLYQNMLHVWTFLFTPATVAVAIGLLALSYAALEPGLPAGAITAVVLVGVTVYGLSRRPVLGSLD
jgi:hypothetical protein